MVVTKWLLVGAIAVVVLALLAGRLGLLAGHMPDKLGVHNGRLAPPSQNPNSVSSQAALYPDHPQRDAAQIAPLPTGGDGTAAMARLEHVVASMPGAKVIRSERGYLYVQFTTRLMRYVDDVEFWLDPAHGVIQVRSASRIGRRDFGVNRARVEAIRARLAAG